MKKIFPLIGVLFGALFLGCSDLSSTREESLKDELPGDFKYGVYAEINNDVEKSQVLLEIQEKVASLYGRTGGEADTTRKRECGNILLQDISLFDDIYEDFMDCPVKGWNPNKPCSGKYAGNANYTKFTVVGEEDTTWRCAVGGCWSGGLNDQFTDYDWEDQGYLSGEEYCAQETCLPPLKGLLTGEETWPGINYLAPPGEPGKINFYINAGRFSRPDVIDTLIGVVCKFIMPEIGSAQEAKNYLQGFQYDSTLIKQHYFLIGRSEGRPYKYCTGGETVERDRDKHALLLTNAQLGSFYDYGRYLFCLNETDYKVYETQEDK